MTKIELWSTILASAEKNVNKHIYNNYLANTKILESADQNLVVEVLSQFHKDYIKDNLLPDLQVSLNKIMDKNLSILFSIKYENEPAKKSTKINIPASNKTKESPAKPMTKKDVLSKKIKIGLNPIYTLENFIVGASNRFVHAAATAVSEHPAVAYNPLFIYGGVGLGKSHILNAIGNKILEKNENLVVVYVNAEIFTIDVVQSIREGKMDKVRLKYRKSDVLLIDDIHQLSGRVSTQEEFFHTFNTLYNSGKQIVLSSDRPPKEISHLEERLRSRFQSGLLSDIGLPDIETREAILYKDLEIENINIPPEVINFIAKKIKYNIRDLKSALANIIAQSNLLKQDIDLTLARKVIKQMIKESIGKETSISRIQEVVCDYFGVTKKMIISKKRQANIVMPRQVAMFIIKDMTNSSTTEIGNSFGKRDHSTVIHAIEKIKNLRKMDKILDDKIEKIVKELSTESV